MGGPVSFPASRGSNDVSTEYIETIYLLPEGGFVNHEPYPPELSERLRLLATLMRVDEEEDPGSAVRGYLDTSGRDAEVSACADRTRRRLRGVLDRLWNL